MKYIYIAVLLILSVMAGCKSKPPQSTDPDNYIASKPFVLPEKVYQEIEDKGGLHNFLKDNPKYEFKEGDTIRARVIEVEPQKKGLFQRVFNSGKYKDKSRVTYNITIKDKSEVTVKDKSKEKEEVKKGAVVNSGDGSTITTTQPPKSKTWLLWGLLIAAILVGGGWVVYKFKLF